jgi:hypothetical protein
VLYYTVSHSGCVGVWVCGLVSRTAIIFLSLRCRMSFAERPASSSSVWVPQQVSCGMAAVSEETL